MNITRNQSLLTLLILLGTSRLSRQADDDDKSSPMSDIFHLQGLIALPPNDENVTEVEVALYFNSFGAISEENMEFAVDIITWQKWQDNRLVFPSNVSVNVSRVELSAELADKIWRPSLYFINEKAGKAEETVETNQLAHIYKNGTVIYSKRLSVVLNCPMKLYRYPHDTQNCPIRISTYGYTTEVVEFAWRKLSPVRFNSNIHLSRFNFNSSPLTRTCEVDYRDVGEFTCLETFIHLKREFGYYLLQIYLPTMLIVVVSWLSFYLPVEAVPARVSVGLITVLTMTTESAKARESLPHVSYVTAIDLWMTLSMVFVFAAMLEYAVICVVYRRSRRHLNKNLYDTTSSTVSAISNKESGQGHHSGVKINLVKSAFIVVSDKRIDVMSRMAFPVVYLIFQVIYWIFYLLPRNDTFEN